MRRILAAVAALATLLAASACGSDDDHSAPAGAATKVSVGVIPIVDVAPIYLGKQRGFFSSRGIDLTMVTEQGGGAVIKSVLAGKCQFGFSNVTSLLTAQTAGAPVKVVANGDASTGRPGRDSSAIVVADGSPIRTAKDLSGKRVAVNALKNLGDTTVRQSVRLAKGDPNTIQFRAMPFGEMPNALLAQEVDAAWVTEPQLSEVLTQGGQIIASNYVDTAPNMTVAMYFTTNPVIDKDPELVKRFTAAINESLQYATGHPEEIRDTVGTYTKINDTVRTAMILPNWPHDVNRASVAKLAALGWADGLFAKQPDVDQLLP